MCPSLLMSELRMVGILCSIQGTFIMAVDLLIKAVNSEGLGFMLTN